MVGQTMRGTGPLAARHRSPEHAWAHPRGPKCWLLLGTRRLAPMGPGAAGEALGWP